MEKLKAFVKNFKWNMRLYSYRAAVIASIIALYIMHMNTCS